MPYSADHKRRTRARIVEAARVLFNRHGFEGVTIDSIMQAADLTRGGFYNHFESKEQLYSEAVASFLHGRGRQWRAEAGVQPERPSLANAERMIAGYLSAAHLDDRDGQCPMIALPSDVARAGEEVQLAYESLLKGMVGVFEQSLTGRRRDARARSLALAALCVGGMVLARTLPRSELADEVRCEAKRVAERLVRSR